MAKKPPSDVGVLVIWRDTTASAEWQTTVSVKDIEPARCRTRGVVVEDIPGKGGKLIVASTDEESGKECDHTTIPNGCIEEIWKLRTYGKYKRRSKR